jgi:hypothetical protein
MASDANTAKAFFNCGIGSRDIDIGDNKLFELLNPVQFQPMIAVSKTV